MRSLETECLILGSGIAGLSTAMALSERGIPCTVVTCAQDIKETNTYHAQGGIIYRALNENPQKLSHDILEAGCNVNYRPAVEQLAKLGPKLVKEILVDEVGVPFDRTEEGEFHLTTEGAHSESRVIHRGDHTGQAIETNLLDYLKKKSNVTFLPQTTAVNLLMTSFHPKEKSHRHESARCFGAFVYHQPTEEVFPICAKNTVLATGGVGQLFLHSTNGKFARGDGLALAFRAGCRVENLEFIQFHPTTFYHPSSRRFLISEALRGEGARLVNANGQSFLSRYLPNYSVPELAPRDKLARAIHQELLSSGAPCVYLDISHKPGAWIQERFPFVYRNCLNYGVDITQSPIPVVPGAHYHCGGVWSNLLGQTSLLNLWAVGEVACTGVHGANRLASTSLLEGLVWGTLAGREIGKYQEEVEFPEIEPWVQEQVQVDPSFLMQDWLTLKHTMWNYVGLIKTEARLQRAEGILTELARGINSFYRKARLSDELIGLRHASLAASLILEACKKRPRSLGCYLREDFEI